MISVSQLQINRLSRSAILFCDECGKQDPWARLDVSFALLFESLGREWVIVQAERSEPAGLPGL